MNERTVASTVSVSGVGLQTGAKATVRLSGAPEGSGVSFVRTDLPGAPALNLRSFDPGDFSAHERRTTIGLGPFEVQTTEHLLAALSGLGVDNAVIEIDGPELPGLDGSARGFVDLIRRAGVKTQDCPRRELALKDAVWIADGDAVLAAFPDDAFVLSYTLQYPVASIGTQFRSFAFSEEGFAKEIAPARTFCLEVEALELIRRGLGKGADHENTLIFTENGPVKNMLRFPDEPVRHKLLDLIGDLCLIGVPLKARIVAIKSGHRMNMELVKRLRRFL